MWHGPKTSPPQIPAPRPRPEKQIWIWQPSVILKKGKLAVKVNDYAPFLRGQLLLPGRAQRVETAPTSYTYKHYITRFEIFVQLKKAAPSALSSLQWIDLDRVSQHIPSTLIKKALDHYKVIEAAR